MSLPLLVYYSLVSPQIVGNNPIKSSVQLVDNKPSHPIDFGKHFQDLGVEGAVIIYDADNNQIYQYNLQRNQTAFLPGSTFKILNSLISLETKAIADEIAILTWDGNS